MSLIAPNSVSRTIVRRSYLVVICAVALGMIFLAGCSASQLVPIHKGAIIEAMNEAGVSARIRIDDIELDPKDSEKETYLYSVSVEESVAEPESARQERWTHFCEPDAENVSKAMPIAGYWDETGRFVESTSKLTLACTNGVIGKCIRWGYKPWKSVALKRLHLACVRMARADYCGNGVGHTKDGTLIDLFDTIGIQDREQGTMELEAGWSPEGATFLNRPRWQPLASIIEECPDKFQGRTAKEFPHISVAEIQSRWPETLLFNDSYPTPRIGSSMPAVAAPVLPK